MNGDDLCDLTNQMRVTSEKLGEMQSDLLKMSYALEKLLGNGAWHPSKEKQYKQYSHLTVIE
jgi:hypothetical protein